MVTIHGFSLNIWKLCHLVFINFLVSVISAWPLCGLRRQEQYQRHLTHDLEVFYMHNFWKRDYFAGREITAARNVSIS
jgi:hypothetical protein